MRVCNDVYRIIARSTQKSSIHGLNSGTRLKHIGADSLEWVMIIARLETAYSIDIDVGIVAELTTIGDFIEYIESCSNQI